MERLFTVYRKKLAKLTNCELFAKIFLANIHRYTENVFGMCTDCSLFAKFSLANTFYLYDLPEFYPVKIFPCTVSPLYSWHWYWVGVFDFMM